jgi:hypothetical protein
MLRTWLEDVIGRLRQLGSHADDLEEENRRLQSELSDLHEARRDNDDTFTVRQGIRQGSSWSTPSPRPRISTSPGPRSGNS